MKRETERRLAALEGAGEHWPEAEQWIVDGPTATNTETGETIPAEELDARDDGQPRVILTIADPAEGEHLEESQP